MKVRLGALEFGVDTVEQLEELVMRYGGNTISMKIRIGALEIEVDTVEQLDEIVGRYGRTTVAADSPASRATAGSGGAPLTG